MSKKDKIKIFFASGAGKKWIQEVHGDEDGGRVTSMRAALRRCKTIDDVMLESSYYELLRAMKKDGIKVKPKQSAIFAIAIAELKSIHGPKFGVAMSNAEGDRATISGLRFRKLLRSEDEDFLRRVRRIARQCQTLDIADFAKIVFYWNDKTKKTLAEKYYKQAKNSEI